MNSQTAQDTSTEVILEALTDAAEAHGKFEVEVLNGVYDVEWPQWYAEHMAGWLREQGFTLARSGA